VRPEENQWLLSCTTHQRLPFSQQLIGIGARVCVRLGKRRMSTSATTITSFGLLPAFLIRHSSGVGSAIMLHILDMAQQQGYHHAWLQPSEMAYPFYERLGFQVCGTCSIYG
jgi:predicted N-acetyltransferase YhbS